MAFATGFVKIVIARLEYIRGLALLGCPVRRRPANMATRLQQDISIGHGTQPGHDIELLTHEISVEA